MICRVLSYEFPIQWWNDSDVASRGNVNTTTHDSLATRYQWGEAIATRAFNTQLYCLQKICRGNGYCEYICKIVTIARWYEMNTLNNEMIIIIKQHWNTQIISHWRHQNYQRIEYETKKYISRPIFWCQFLLSNVKTKCGKEANFYCFNYCCESSRFEFLPCARFCRPHNNTHIVSLCTVCGPSESYKFFWSLESPWIVFYSQRELKTRLIKRHTIPKVEKRAVQGSKSNCGRFTDWKFPSPIYQSCTIEVL